MFAAENQQNSRPHCEELVQGIKNFFEADGAEYDRNIIDCEFEDDIDIGKFNPPEIFHINLECKRMFVQLVKDFRIIPSVAALSLIATNF